MIATETTTRTWESGGMVLLQYDSGDREPFYIPEKFHTADSLRELRAAIDEALKPPPPPPCAFCGHQSDLSRALDSRICASCWNKGKRLEPQA